MEGALQAKVSRDSHVSWDLQSKSSRETHVSWDEEQVGLHADLRTLRSGFRGTVGAS